MGTKAPFYWGLNCPYLSVIKVRPTVRAFKGTPSSVYIWLDSPTGFSSMPANSAAVYAGWAASSSPNSAEVPSPKWY